jgi:hypothetical protein
MKKIAFILIFTALSMFMSVALVSADGKGWRGFHGEYAGTATGSCLYSFLLFEPGFTVPTPSTFPPPDAFGSTIVAEGSWTFERNGTGSFKGKQFGISFPPFPGRSANVVDIIFDFAYTIQHDGKITITMEDGTFVGTYEYGPNADLTYTVDQLEIAGIILNDKKTISLMSGGADVQTYTLPGNVKLYGICNVVYDLLLVDR